MTHASTTDHLTRRWRALWLISALALYLVLTGYRLGLPGLHYDEAKEAGVNAVELLSSAPLTAFRGASVRIAGIELPLMVQDYIGALNVYLALPFLGLTGIGVPNLRFLPVLTGLTALLALERAISTWIAMHRRDLDTSSTPIAVAALIAMTLLAASPSFVFWSRQGIFVTNLTQPLVFIMIWQGLRWLRTGHKGAIWLSAFSGGLALYAKLLSIWIVGPFALLAGGWWLWQRSQGNGSTPRLTISTAAGMIIAFLLPLTPLLIFNIQTGGTLSAVSDNLGQSYYGVDNLAIMQNLPLRAQQIIQTLSGDHLWYLGGIFRNPLAAWLAMFAVIIGIVKHRELMLGPLLLAGVAFALSLFTISDLFITHYTLMHPLLIAIVGIGLSTLWPESKGNESANKSGSRKGQSGAIAVVIVVTLFWLALDVTASLGYHNVLADSGGLADHSDASYHLAYHLQYNGLSAPIALDWGLDAPIRYLSHGTVRPIEIFGYTSVQAPDPDFQARLDIFLPNTNNVYLLRAPEQTVFAGRREAFLAAAEAANLAPTLESTFRQQDGVPLFELWRVRP